MRRDLLRPEPKEPLHHASSQHALQRGGALPSAGSGSDSMAPNNPASPKLQARRLSQAQPASVSDGIAGVGAIGTGRAPGMTAAGVLASPYPGCRSMLSDHSTHLEQAIP